MTHPALAIRLGAAALLAFALFAAGRALLEGRLEIAAAERAAQGDASAVARAVADWAEAVVPVAMSDDGAAGVRARLAVFERLDAHRATGATDRFVSDAEEALAIARRSAMGDGATRSGVAWSRRLAERVGNEAPRLAAPNDRLRLLTAADGVLSVTPVVRVGPPTRQRPVDPPASSAVAQETPSRPSPAPASDTPRSAVERFVTAPTAERSTAPRSIAEATDAEAGWRPNWAPAPLAESPVEAEPPEPRKAPSADHALLAELMESVDADADAWREPLETRRARASGPVSISETSADRAARERRERLQERLAARGFRGVSTDQVAALLDPSPKVRAALADRLLTSRSGDAVRLLLMLAEDEDATVRAAAVAAMGLSADRRLVERAWRIALRDPDPVVGRLAETLRVQLRQASVPMR